MAILNSVSFLFIMKRSFLDRSLSFLFMSSEVQYLQSFIILEIMWNANLMQQDNFIDIFLPRHVSGTYAPHQ